MLVFMAGCGEEEKEKPEDALGETPQQEQKIEQGDVDVDTLEDTKAEDTSVDEDDKGKTAVATASNPLKGYIVSINEIAAGGNGRISKARAMNLVNSGQLLGFKAGGKVYLVYGTNGYINSKQLAKYAPAEYVGIIGKVKHQNGMNYIIADKIRPME
jgi:hypothetical protein